MDKVYFIEQGGNPLDRSKIRKCLTIGSSYKETGLTR